MNTQNNNSALIRIVQGSAEAKGEQRSGKWIAGITLSIENNSGEEKSVTIFCRVTHRATGEQAACYKFHTFTSTSTAVTKAMLLYIAQPHFNEQYDCCIQLLEQDKVTDEQNVSFEFKN
ncbi:MAG: hypothetical protein II574_09705 [Ruminococcus sp.]|nr:hypothetical protein [Ruminococcus sp.]